MSTTTTPPPSRLDPEPVPRRDVLGLAAMASAAGACLLALAGLLRLPKAAVLSSPSKKFKAVLPENLAAGEAFVPAGRSVALFRDGKLVHFVPRFQIESKDASQISAHLQEVFREYCGPVAETA